MALFVGLSASPLEVFWDLRLIISVEAERAGESRSWRVLMLLGLLTALDNRELVSSGTEERSSTTELGMSQSL